MRGFFAVSFPATETQPVAQRHQPSRHGLISEQAQAAYSAAEGSQLTPSLLWTLRKYSSIAGLRRYGVAADFSIYQVAKKGCGCVCVCCVCMCVFSLRSRVPRCARTAAL